MTYKTKKYLKIAVIVLVVYVGFRLVWITTHGGFSKSHACEDCGGQDVGGGYSGTGRGPGDPVVDVIWEIFNPSAN
jgi:hypothetical protein